MQHALRILAAAAMIAVGLWIWLYAGNDGAETPDTAATSTAPAAQEGYDLARARAQIAEVAMTPDTSFLSAEQKAVVNKLIQAADLMSQIFFRQYYAENPAVEARLEAADIPDKDLVLSMFKMNGGPFDTFAEQRPFFGDTPYPVGAGFYPEDMTREEFEGWVAAHPEDKEAFESLYTVIHRDGDRLKAVPYSVEYREWLEPAAKLLKEAAAITTNASLKKFLTLRADAFLSDDYYPSEIAWMDLSGPIEVVIGPYEVYTDGLFGYKAAFEAFVTLKTPADSAALDAYKARLPDMEANLPVPDAYKNFKRKFQSPIIVANQIHGGGDNVPGVQTIAFNLPNDERVREAKGAKKVLLKNVMDAKFERILSVMSPHVVVAEQQGLLDQKYFFLETLFHELAHSLGPGAIVKDGRETTVNAELKETYSALEEGKADVMGVYNILYMMDEGELPAAERYNLLTTYVVGLFRSVRFGLTEAHAQGAAFQLAYFREAGAFTTEPGTGLLRIDFPALELAIKNLVHDIVVIQGDGDYAAAKAFLDRYVVLDATAKAILAGLADVPVDIEPAYPDRV
jgi:Peptidase family M49